MEDLSLGHSITLGIGFSIGLIIVLIIATWIIPVPISIKAEA